MNRKSVIALAVIFCSLMLVQDVSAYYSAKSGRFVSRDPIGYKGSEWNLYEYVSSAPQQSLDPRGRSGWQINNPFGEPGNSDFGPNLDCDSCSSAQRAAVAKSITSACARAKEARDAIAKQEDEIIDYYHEQQSMNSDLFADPERRQTVKDCLDKVVNRCDTGGIPVRCASFFDRLSGNCSGNDAFTPWNDRTDKPRKGQITVCSGFFRNGNDQTKDMLHELGRQTCGFGDDFEEEGYNAIYPFDNMAESLENNF